MLSFTLENSSKVIFNQKKTKKYDDFFLFVQLKHFFYFLKIAIYVKKKVYFSINSSLFLII